MTDRCEFSQTYEELSEPVFRHCYFRLFNRERAREISQEAFMKTWEYLQKGKKVDNLRAFIYRVAHNLVVNEIRGMKKVSSLDKLQEEDGFDISNEDHHNIVDRAEVDRVRHMLKLVKEEDARLVVMRFIDDLSIREISKILRVSENVVSVRLHRVLSKLKALSNQAD